MKQEVDKCEVNEQETQRTAITDISLGESNIATLLQRCDNEECLAALKPRPYLKERKVG